VAFVSGCSGGGDALSPPTMLLIKTTSLPSGQVDTPYSTTLAASDGTPPYEWSVTSGALPPGLTLAAATGVISGTPTTAENAEAVTVQVTDSGTPRQSSSQSLSLKINANTLRVGTTSVPSGKVGAPYSATLAASGGTPPYQWSVSSGALPPGLTLAAATGVISGTPTTAENAEALTVQVSDSGTPRQTGSQSLSVTISPATLRVTTASLPSGQVGTPYSATLAASGGTPPYQWSVSSGALPPGLSLAAATGVISGTPTTPENAEALTVQVSDSGTPRQSGSRSLSVTINATTLRVATTSLPSGQVSTSYSTTLAASGGTAPYHWSVTSGALPPGLTLAAATGVISGTPTTPENAEALTVQVSDSGTPRQSSSKSLSVTINATTLRVGTTSLKAGQVGAPYSATLAASGGTPPYRWSVTSGALPPGLTLAAATGVISGTPTTAENAEAVSIQVTDSGTPRQSSSQSLSVTVNAATLRFTTTSLPSGQVGTSYSTTLAASGGTPPYQWSVSSGALPPGLTLAAATGVISGTPTTAENAEAVSIQVSDSGTPRQSSAQSLSLTISPATLRVTTTALPSGQVGTSYSATLAASGGTPPYQWSVSSGTLPPGLSLAAATGVISGTPTTAENAEAVTVQVSDSGTPRQSSAQSLSLTISPATLRVTTTALPSGQVGAPYSATLAASGGTPPYQWSVSSGTLPPGLSLAAATGVISGTPAAAANATKLTFKVTDSGTPAQLGYAPLTLTVSPGNITISISPASAALTVTQVATLAATTNDSAGVKWSISPSGGSLSAKQSLSGVPIKLTAPSAAGVYSLTATSVTDPTVAASIRVAVTDLPGVFTYHNDLARDGVNGQEYALTPSNVAAGFGKIFTCAVDGAVHSQPLWMANLMVGGARHNVVFVATAHDSLFAFDADASPCVKLWQASLIDQAHGATAGETTVPSGTTGYLVGKGNGNITPEVGVIGTPVIDSASGTLYVVSKSTAIVSGTAAFYQRLHAIDVTTGLERASSPVLIQGTYPGSGDGGSMDTWNARLQNQRAGLVLANGTVYITWASHEDKSPYYGWVMGYRYGTSGFTQTAVLNVTPNVQYGGIWMSGAAPSVDSNGNLYLITGNGGFDVTNTSAPHNDYGDSFLELSINASPASPQSAFSIPQWFTPSDQQIDDNNDKDFGSGGAAVLADVIAGNPPVTTHLVVGGGKDGALYVLNRDRMGGYGDVNAWEIISLGKSIYSMVAFWNDTIYVAPVGGPLASYVLSAANTPVEFKHEYTAISPTGGYGYPGATPAISASGATNAIVWTLDTQSLYCTSATHGCEPVVLHAYDPANQLNEIWNSSLAAGGADAAGNAIQYTVPTIANGKVYVGTRGNNTGGATTSTTVPGELDVYGLKTN
jgi:hypothetical protein